MSPELVHTMVLMATAMAAGISLVLLSAYRSFPKDIQGLGYWCFGAAVSVLIGPSYGLVYVLPQAWALIIANSMVFVSTVAIVVGTMRFFRRTIHWPALLGFSVTAYLGILWFLLLHDDFPLRVVIAAFFLCSMYLLQVFLILRYGDRHFSSYFLVALLLIQTLAILNNACHIYQQQETPFDIFHGGFAHQFYLYSNTFMSLLIGVGIMLMSTHELQKCLMQHALTDPLTQALNRRGFDIAYQQKNAAAASLQMRLSALVIDIDYFKAINDQYGHGMGDLVLVDIVRTIRDHLKPDDVLARFGGEEFVVLSAVSSIDTAVALANAIQRQLVQQRAQQTKQQTQPALPAYTISIGIALQKDDGHAEALIHAADRALYQAKKKGRNRVCVEGQKEFDPVLSDDAKYLQAAYNPL